MFHIEHTHLVHKMLHDKMSKVYLFQAFLTFVKSLIGIFAPVYLYSIGFTLTKIMLFIMGISFTYLLIIPFSISLINKIGFKYTIMVSIPVYITHIISLNFITPESIYIFCLAWFSYGSHMALFWPSMHSEIAANGNKKKSGSEVGTLQILTTIFGSIAPLIGGLYLELLSYTQLVTLSFIIVLLGSIPLIFSKDIKLKSYYFKHSDYTKFLFSKKQEHKKSSFIAEGVNGFLNLSLWPILLYILLSESFLKLGSLYTLVSIISVLIISYLKTYIDKHNKRKVLKKTVKLISLAWGFRLIIYIFAGFFIYIVESVAKMISSAFYLSYMSIFYNNARNRNVLDYVILRELGIHGSKILTGLLVIILLKVFGETKEVFMLLIIVGMISAIWLGKLHEENFPIKN